MTEANKKSLKDVLMIVGGFGLYVLLATIIPNGSIAQKIIAILMVVALIASAVWFTPLGNPFKRWLQKRNAKK